MDIKQYRVKPGSKWQADDAAARDTHGLPDSKSKREEYVAQLAPELDTLQDMLYAEHKHKVLIVLQGMDTSGKDGTIRAVFQSVDPLGVRVQAFKAPTATELEYDYLWRVHQVVPKQGEIVIFNRSHYEDVLVTRVREWIDGAEEKRRLQQINDFERLLSETGTEIIKIFLHISKDEQRERLQKRLDEPEKNWKFNPGDLEDRKLWDQFQAQYGRVISATSTEYAPWYVVPADSKSGRNVIILNILLAHLRALDMRYPKVDTRTWPKVIK